MWTELNALPSQGLAVDPRNLQGALHLNRIDSVNFNSTTTRLTSCRRVVIPFKEALPFAAVDTEVFIIISRKQTLQHWDESEIPLLARHFDELLDLHLPPSLSSPLTARHFRS